jgi:hypothetical protein
MSDEFSKRGERNIKEGTDKIMKEAQKKAKLKKEAEKSRKVLFNYSVQIISTGEHDQEDVDTINRALTNMRKTCATDYKNLELRIEKYVEE